MSGKKACPLRLRQIFRDFAQASGLWRHSAQAKVCGSDFIRIHAWWWVQILARACCFKMIADGYLGD